MKKLILLFVLLPLLFGQCKSPSGAAGGFKVLVFSKTKGWRHDSIGEGKIALLQLGKTNSFAVDTTENAALFTSQNLANYQVVVFLNTTLDVLDNAQQAAFEQYIRSGKGFVGVHAAADTEYDWAWYGKLVGAYSNGHPPNSNLEADVQVIDRKHISTKHLPAVWHRSDEWYNYKNINPDIHILCNLDEKSYVGGTNGASHPIAWHHEYDGGRAFYTGGGHGKAAYSEPLFLQHLLGGIRWAAGK